MRLVGFSVKSYRSIVNTERIQLSNKTVIVGPNNEGKSNLLRALILGMNTLMGRLSRYRPTQFGLPLVS